MAPEPRRKAAGSLPRTADARSTSSRTFIAHDMHNCNELAAACSSDPTSPPLTDGPLAHTSAGPYTKTWATKASEVSAADGSTGKHGSACNSGIDGLGRTT